MNEWAACPKGEIMRTRTQVLVAVVVAIVLASLTVLLLLSGNVKAAVWMYGPYFLISLLLPGGIDTLTTLVIFVTIYYFVISLFAIKQISSRTLILVILIAIFLNSLGLYVFLLMSKSG
jgi:hypothetical protein